MDVNKLISIVVIPIIVILSIVIFTPKGTTLLKMGGTIEPDTFYYGDFTLKEAGLISFSAEVDNEEGKLLCYVVQWDPTRFDSLKDQLSWVLDQKLGFIPEELGGPWSYVKIMGDGSEVSFELNLEPGEWGFIVVQTVGWLGEVKYSAKVTTD